MSKESKAKEYAQNVAGSLIESALEAAYLEGFNAGVESVEHPVTQIIENGVRYVDLGLPSGTLWASNLWPENGYSQYFKSYQDALKYNIPNKEQVEELINSTKVVVSKRDHEASLAYIVGPNGSKLYWRMYGKEEDEVDRFSNVACWIRDEESCQNNKASCLHIGFPWKIEIEKEFTGFHMPLALVKTKE